MCVTVEYVTPSYPRGNFIQWKVDPNQMPPGPWTFTVERSESPQGPFETLGTVVDNTAYFDSLPTHHIMRYWYYRVSLQVRGSCCFISEPEANLTSMSTLNKRLKGEVETMRNDLRVLLQADNGVKIQIFKKRNFGQRCTSCRSGLLDLAVYPNCTKCFGTKFLEGFYNPITTLAYFNDPPTQEGLDQEGETELRVFQIKMLESPLLTVDDIIFEPDTGQLYEVKNVMTTRRKRVIIHQEVNLSELARSHQFYKLVNNILEDPLGTEIFVFDEQYVRY